MQCSAAVPKSSTRASPGEIPMGLRTRKSVDGPAVAFAAGGVAEDFVRLLEHFDDFAHVGSEVEQARREEAGRLERAAKLEEGAAHFVTGGGAWDAEDGEIVALVDQL